MNWLRDWVDTGNDVPALAHQLTMAGLEIEGIHRAGPELSGIVVGEVLAVEKHPDAEKLNVCRVSNGREELQIVCGAPNVRAGMKAPLALIGAKLPNGTEIKKAKLRGVESNGMLCSARELGLSEESSGLLDLPQHVTTGQDLVAALQLDDTILEVNLTPNRGDCMSVAGIAREAAAARATPLKGPEFKPVAPAITDTFPVRLEATAACPKFAGRVIRGINIGAKSPWWMQERLRRAGLRPISAVVDVTNYVMLELGQPMHAYDLGQLSGSIVVRSARAGEKLKLLDGRTIELTPDIAVIADEKVALGMAGVMGGEDSGISDATKDVFLEVAFFEPDAVAGRGRRYGLITDASQRFERGVDPQLQERAIERATQLLLECAGGQAGPTVVTRHDGFAPRRSAITLRHRRVRHVLGVQLSDDTVLDCLRRLNMEIEAAPGDDLRASWLVTPPSWRFDIHIEEDLIEEVARLYGFDNIPEQDAIGDQAILPWTETRVRNERAADLLVARGYHEAITYTFTDAQSQSVLFGETALALSNPISAELGVMRLSLWPGLVHAARENHRRQQHRVRLFEIGRRFASKTGAETEMIAGVASGSALAEQWGAETAKVDFFDVKADVEALIALSDDADAFRFTAEKHPALHPGQSARLWRGDRPVGWIGALHPQHLKALDLTYPLYVFELEVAGVLAARVPEFREISKYPAIRRDVAVIVDEAIPVEALESAIRKSAGTLLTDVSVLSVYRGKQFEKGKKSIALGLQLQDTSRTLTDHDADAIVAQVVDALSHQLNATIRDK
ncbi:phenylalanyl-tRNA synthetase beta chain [Povalibacter uvarum]|uniref:Phenylalanine--tRNA ligase beta subunit n=1 Tax=Povalibacter uvarum TaxID=732238 RepID=A0A841HI20_9GAMM|nr:phenylalanine--tRNA ligase subunit beta [Povalibacter uvarum]MBB6092029.1 phenylalanyl-tRNA synthetase beta chain [Povalibacter uvarum]